MMRALLVGLGVCLLGAGAYGIALLIELRAATAPATPTAFVQATWSVYRFGPGHRAHVGQLSLACPACHQAQENGRFDRPGPGACVACHEAKATIEHAMVNVDTAGQRVDAGASAHEQSMGAGTEERVSDCLVCHGFGPDPEKQPSDCLSCHAHARGHTPAIVTHADVDCQDCHEVHENRIAPLKCTECHSIQAQHGHARASSHADAPTGEASVEQTCLTCHQAHGRAASALEGCRTCHTPEASAHAETNSSVPTIAASATFDGHTCTGCHAPHAFTKESVAACTSCHTQVHVLAGKGHQSCTGCHAPHSARESVARNVCVDCHKDVALRHSDKIDASAACTSCHAVHPSSAQQTTLHSATSACTHCHQQVGQNGQQAHAGNMACTSCHKPHAFALPAGQSACTACHALEAKRTHENPGHESCAGCHQNLPHGAQLAPQACTSCHKEVHAQKGHAQCTNCHEPHEGAQNGKVCADCHASEARTGIHVAARVEGGVSHTRVSAHSEAAGVRCTQCHDQHTTLLAKGVADCTACHTQAKLPGLHEVREHAAACTSCHAPHAAAPPGARATCLQCHEDRKDHQPAAPRCEGCHQFVPAAQGARRAL